MEKSEVQVGLGREERSGGRASPEFDFIKAFFSFLVEITILEILRDQKIGGVWGKEGLEGRRRRERGRQGREEMRKGKRRKRREKKRSREKLRGRCDREEVRSE